MFIVADLVSLKHNTSCVKFCNSHFDIYLTPVKTQLLQYNLTRDLMLFLSF